ncbi:HAMP domain-containing sensor histidine kinase [uncultured Clostridium sp.]|uniref:sensor histidine kinase n=1 Tax=uncultured Clostridium sp. TaxID=59620 RepID=UPI0026135D64|nr:HAMP domain-containing sensor histidine kinase [uncultured Clostridium sp.]
MHEHRHDRHHMHRSDYEKLHKGLKRHKKMMHEDRKNFHRKMNELFFLSKYIRIFRKITLIVTLVIILFLLKVIGFKVATVIIVLILLINEGTIIYMISRMEKRFVNPMSKLQGGVRKIAEGDYSVRLEATEINEVGLLTNEFNEMARRLEEAEKVKKDYEENRKSLITNISHDLKTPITSINGYVEGLLEKVVPEENVDNYLKVIKSNAAYMNRLIDDLFLFSKLDMQKLEFVFNKTNIKLYIEDIVEEFYFILEEKQIGFEYSLGIEEETFVNIDGKRLYRALRNIIDNAIKYGQGREDLKIEISLYSNLDNIFITISDNGYGIEEESVDKIFKRFYRVDKERTKDFNSTGLGLAITKEIIDAHNGEIYVSSEVNVGTSFTIQLPIYNEGDEIDGK